MKLPISLVVVTLNEEANIERCLRSVPFASDVVVVDSFSTDRTLEIAQKLGANVIQEKWRGYGPQKSFAVSKAKNDWILSLDADEALSPELQQEIVERFASLNPEVGYELSRRSFHLGRWISHGGWYPDAQLRLFHRQYSQWSSDALHEKVQVKHKERFRQDLLHWVFDNLSDQVVTNDKYSSLGAENLAKSGRHFSLLKLIFKPWTKFVECYFLKQGFRDGLPGFIIAVSAAYSIFLRHGKLWELEMKKRKLS
jgi:glycosyltransferase involved in cell wall biosynthesis